MRVTSKNFCREIKKSTGRFLSILFIVALGVAFFSGIRASEPDMRLTGDSYFDSEKLMDVKAISTLGITADDVRAFEELDLIEKAEGAYSADFLTNVKDDQYALRILSMCKEMNQIQVEEGRLPKAAGECLADAEMGYKVGDKIALLSGTDEKVTDTLKTSELEVVGVGSTPMYISFGRGSTTIGTGNIEGFLFVPKETFDLDVYTEVYMLVKGAKELTAYTDEYEDLIDKAMEEVEDLSGERGIIRRRELVDDATEELDKAKMDLEEGRRKAEQELNDAARKIADAQSQINDAKQKITDGRAQIASAKEMLAEKQEELNAARQEYESGVAALASGRQQYETEKAKFEEQKPDIEASIAAGEAALEPLKNQMDFLEKRYEQLMQELAGHEEDESEEFAAKREEASQIQAQIELYYGSVAQLEETKQQLALAEEQFVATKQMLDQSELELQDAAVKLQGGQEQINAGWAEIYQNEAELESGMSEIAGNEAKLEDAKAELEEGRAEAARELAEGEEKIAEAEKEIADIPEAVWYIYDRNTLPEYSGYGENADRMKAIGRVFPIIFFLVAALIALTSMTRMVEEQRVQIGTMKALGYSNGAIAKKYMGYALLATAGGSVLGFLVGEKVLPFIIIYAYGIMYHHIPDILTPYIASYALQAAAVSVICTLFATWASCIRELRAQPAELMRPASPKSGKRVVLEHIPFIWKRLNFTWKSTIRNLLRYKKRFFMTIFGISGCMGMMILGYGIKDSVYEIAQTQYEEIQIYDGQIILQEDLTEEDREHLNTYLDDDKDIVNHMDAYMKNVIVTKGKVERQTYICVMSDLDEIPEYVDFHDRKTKEKKKLDDTGVIVSEKTAKLLGAGVGDTISIKDEKDGNKDVVIADIVENYMGHYMYMTPYYYKKIFGEAPEYNSILFSMDDSFDKKKMEDAGKKIVNQEEVLSISYLHDIEEQLDNMLGSLNLVIIVLIVSAGMLAFVVLYNLNTINITERQRELATLKVLGFYNKEVAEYVFRENIILTFVGAAGGVVLGKILHAFVIETVEVDAAMFGRSIYLPSFIYSLVFTIVFSLVINGLMYLKLKKIDMVESLKSVE